MRPNRKLSLQAAGSKNMAGLPWIWREISEELRAEWLLEAWRRAEELDSGSVQSVPGEDVMRKARALIK